MQLEIDNERYIRQKGIIGLPVNFQQILKNSSVLLLGAGGLGCAASIYLAAAGIGKITVVDRDIVNLSNLNRQILYTENDLDKEKANLCAERIHNQNPYCETYGLKAEISNRLLTDIVPKHDIVLDLCDNYPTRIEISSACHKYNKKSVIGAVNGLEGFVMLTDKDSSCFACLYPKEVSLQLNPPRVLGSVVGNIGTLAATKCILALCGIEKYGVMYCVDFVNMNIDEIQIPKNHLCAICSV